MPKPELNELILQLLQRYKGSLVRERMLLVRFQDANILFVPQGRPPVLDKIELEVGSLFEEAEQALRAGVAPRGVLESLMDKLD